MLFLYLFSLILRPKITNQLRINDDEIFLVNNLIHDLNRTQDAWKNYGQNSPNFEKLWSAYRIEESKKDKWEKKKSIIVKLKRNLRILVFNNFSVSVCWFNRWLVKKTVFYPSTFPKDRFCLKIEFFLPILSLWSLLFIHAYHSLMKICNIVKKSFCSLYLTEKSSKTTQNYTFFTSKSNF